MASNSKNSSKRPARSRPQPIHLTVSYREAARLVGRSKTHIHEVCLGTRKSPPLVEALAPYIAR